MVERILDCVVCVSVKSELTRTLKGTGTTWLKHSMAYYTAVIDIAMVPLPVGEINSFQDIPLTNN